MCGSRTFAAGSATTPELPKKPVLAYALFIKSERMGKTGVSMEASRAIMKELGSKWRAMSDVEKGPFITQEAKSREEYNRAIARMDPQVLFLCKPGPYVLHTPHKSPWLEATITSRNVAKEILGIVFVRGRYNPCLYFHPRKDFRTFLRGDDVATVGTQGSVKWLKEALENILKSKLSA